MRFKKLFVKVSFILLVASSFLSCSTQQNLDGFWGGDLAFSEFEVMTSNLLLESDSTFFYINWPLQGAEAQGYVGSWHVKDEILALDGGKSLQLLLAPKADKLELLDFEGKEVIGQKKLLLEKQNEGEITGKKFIATGRFHHFADASNFRFCGSDKLFTVAMTEDHISAERMFLSLLESNPDEDLFIQALVSFQMLPKMDGGQSMQLIIHELMDHISACD
jgi:hypothetical protein